MKEMKIKIGALAFVALSVMMFSISSCKKEEKGKLSSPASAETVTKSKKMKAAVVKTLRDFTFTISGGSSTSTSSGSGSSTYSDPALSITTYSTPSSNVYVWSDPTTGTVFTFTESTTGGGLGQLSYGSKSFDYNYVLSIKASSNDPSWDGFFNGRDLRGCVAIDGELTDTDFTLRNMAMFFVATDGGSGTYKFLTFDATSVSNEDAVGEMIDLSDVSGSGATLSGLGDNGKIFVTSGGHINVSESAFEMASDAKIKDVISGSEYTLDGSIMFE